MQNFVLAVLSVSVNMLRGTPKFDSLIGIESCDLNSWLILAAFFAVCIVLTVINIKQVNRERFLRVKFGMLRESQIWMEMKNMPSLLIFSFLAAFIGQMFGLGGAFILGPVLLHFKLHPKVSGSTCLYMMIFSSGTSLLMFLVFGRLNVPYTLFISIFSNLGVILGLFAIGALMKRYDRPSLIAFALALAIFVANIMAIVSNSRSLIKQNDAGINLF